MISLKKENMKDVADRQLSSNEIEKVLELQNSTLLRRLPNFGYPDFGFGHGLGMFQEEADVTIDTPQQNVEGMLEQQKMLQNLLKQYQKSLIMDNQWINSKNLLDVKYKKRFSGSRDADSSFEKREEHEKSVKESPAMEEVKTKLRLKKEEDGKVFSKQRKTNFTSKEVETLLDCVREKKEVILFGVAGGRGWAKAWQDIAKVVSKVEGIQRSEGDVRKKWTYLKWEAKNTSKPGRDPVSKQVLNILTSRDREVQEAMSLRNIPEKYGDDGKGRTKYREIYEKIAHQMFEDKGYRKTAGQCKVKWKHMKASFMEAIKKQDRMLCPIYFDQMYKLLEQYLEKELRNVAKAMLVPDFCQQPVYRGRASKKGSLNFKINAMKNKEEDEKKQQENQNFKIGEGSRPQRSYRPKKYKYILPALSKNPANITTATSLPLSEMARDWCVPVKMENDSDIVIKEEPLNYDSDEMENGTGYENFNKNPSPFVLVPPANPSQQPQQPTPTPSPQVQPQPSPPPVITQKKSNLPPLAPKPVGNKLPQSSGAQNIKQPPKLLPKPQSPPEVCLRWNSYHSNMQNTFPSLLNNEQFVDVTLACDGRSIKCHKVMLSACSPYMEELLSSNPCQHPIIFLKDMKFWQLQALVDFMYRGEVNVTQDKLPNLLSAAEALQIKGLASPVNHSAPPKITQVQPMPTTQHDLSDEMDQVTYMRQLQLRSEVKGDYDDEYMQDTDDSPPPTPKMKKRKTTHSIPQSSSHNNGTPSTNGNKSLAMDIKKERKRERERHSEPSTSQHILSSAQALLNQQNEARRKSDADKLTDSENEYKNYGDDNRHGSNQDEDLDIDEEHAQIILERYSSQNEDCYSRGGDGDVDDNSTTSG